MTQRVVVTGLGLLTPFGLGCQKNWQQLVEGKSAIRAITRFDTEQLPVRFAGQIPEDTDLQPWIPQKVAKVSDVFVHYGLAATHEAYLQSGLQDGHFNPERAGVMVGTGMGGLPGMEAASHTLKERGARRVSPFFIPSTVANMLAGQISIRYGFQGPCLSVVTACSTGLHNIGEAYRSIKHGYMDVMIAGGAEYSVIPLSVAGFAASRALSVRNDDPARACRPFDKDRDGFVMGEGAGTLVLESYEHAKNRGATILAELTGYAATCDAFHITSPPEDGRGAMLAMKLALDEARLAPSDLQYINAHGTSTPLGDVAETKAIKGVFGDYARELAVTSSKSMMGHLLGATGAVEAAITILSIKEQVATPTINLENPDPECDLYYVPHESENRVIESGMTNSFGFGGTNASMIFSRLR